MPTAPAVAPASVPGPILAAWMSLMFRADLAARLTNADQTSADYLGLLQQFSFTPALTAQWNQMMAQLRPSDVTLLQAAQQLYASLMTPAGYPFACPTQTQLVAVAEGAANGA